MYDISVAIFEEYEGDLDAEWLIAVARTALSAEGVDDGASAGIAIADDETVAELNAEHRGLDDTTDVLSFSPVHSGAYYGDDRGDDNPFPLDDGGSNPDDRPANPFLLDGGSTREAGDGGEPFAGAPESDDNPTNSFPLDDGGSNPDDRPANPFPLDGGSTREAGDGGDQKHETGLGRGAHPHPNLPSSRGKESIGGDEFDFILPPDYSDANVGEVIISLPQARRQAKEAAHSLENEIAALLAHGIYHLLGYDHEVEEDAERMRPRERAAMAAMKHAGLIQ